MNPNEILRRFPRASAAFIKANCDTHSVMAPKIPNPVLKQAGGSEPLQSDEVKEGGETRTIVRITRLGTKYLDADNLCGGTKIILDELRYAGLIRDDDPASIKLEVRQAKVSKAQIGTLIEIIH